jgi:AcrR family transcriptional regulator
MPDPVKTTRRYDSPRRREQAEATRTQILEAAGRLFERQGYGPTTMAAIAREAGVALKTVYVAFETKSGLLRELWHLLVRGGAGNAPVQDRDWFREVLDEPGPRRQLELNARNSRAVKERAAGLLAVLRGAAPSDPEIAELWARIQTDFYENQRAIVQSLDAKHALRSDLDVPRATDLLWTLNHPDVWQLLVRERGWTPEAYERWFAATAASQLLKTRR